MEIHQLCTNGKEKAECCTECGDVADSTDIWLVHSTLAIDIYKGWIYIANLHTTAEIMDVEYWTVYGDEVLDLTHVLTQVLQTNIWEASK